MSQRARTIDLVLSQTALSEISRRIKAQGNTVAPTIILLAADGIDGGQVECTIVDTLGWISQTGPLPPSVKIAKSRRRRKIEPEFERSSIAIDDLILDRSAVRVWRGSHEVHVSPIEFKLLELFMSFPGRPFTRMELQEEIWGSSGLILGRTVDVTTMRLRRALIAGGEADPIRTIRGVGYMLNAANDTGVLKGTDMSVSVGGGSSQVPDGNVLPSSRAGQKSLTKRP
ncbi:MAG: response regulator transcription factor [Bradyrhizobium sp.]|nr:response regulator transcription factor [Bradyrhizobium sp.]